MPLHTGPAGLLNKERSPKEPAVTGPILAHKNSGKVLYGLDSYKKAG